MIKSTAIILFIFALSATGLALEPNEILVIANKDIPESGDVAQYYCHKRNVPSQNILFLSLGSQLHDWISRKNYNKDLAEPIRRRLIERGDSEKIRCLLTTYGVPIKVGKRGPLPNMQDRLNELNDLVKQEKEAIGQLEQQGLVDSPKHKEISHRLARMRLEIDRINGRETNAAVDSELSLILFGSYDLYRWQPNMLKDSVVGADFMTLMVSRLDGPDLTIVKGLVDKAIIAEQQGLKGIIYIDSRGIVSKNTFGRYDQSLRDLVILARLQTDMTVRHEQTSELFAPGECPQTAIYCGWYSLKKYVDAFDFVDGAVGYHISSFEAVNLRDPNSSQWCPAMLKDGVTATLGAVAEPYLHAFPEPRAFFQKLFNGICLVEAYYSTKQFNSWQLVLIGDPLYRPFKKS